MTQDQTTWLAPRHWVDHTAAEARAPRGSRSIRAIAEVIFATSDGPPPVERLDWLAARSAELREAVRGRGMFVFGLCVVVVTWLAPLWSLLPVPLGALGIARRTRVLERWERSPFGMTLFAVKAVLSIVWCEHPDTAREMGFDGRPLLLPAGEFETTDGGADG